MKEWIIYSLACLLLWGLWGVVLKLAYGSGNWVQVYFASALSSFLVALTVFIISRPEIPLNRFTGLALIAGVFGGLGYVAFIKALETGKASIVIPLTAIYPAITVVIALAFLNEKISFLKGLGIALAVVAAVLLSL